MEKATALKVEKIHQVWIPNSNVEEITDEQVFNITNSETGERKFLWSYDDTQLLLAVIEKHFEDMSNPHPHKKKLFWKTVQLELNSCGVQFPAIICKQKWLNMVRTYKVIKANMNKSDTPTGKSKRFYFYDKVEELLKRKGNIILPQPADSSVETSAETEDMEADEKQISIEQDSDEFPIIVPRKTLQKNKKTFLTNSSNYARIKLSYVKAKNDAFKEYINKSLAIKQQKLNLYRRKVKALEELVELMKEKDN